MSVPVNVVVGPYTYTVSVSGERICELEKESKDELYGVTVHGSLEIVLQPNVADMVMRETLMHEVLHTVLYNTGLSDRMTEKTEEHLVRALSPALFMLLRNNPVFVQYVTGNE